tara:strand:- start:45 stop:632 length:588 start_codon:yes stop_codon:yes gene_type:complete
MLDWAERVGFRVPDRLAFGRDGLPGAYGGRFRNDWEPLIWFQRPSNEDGYFGKDAISEPTKSPRGRVFKTFGRSTDGSMVKEWTTPYDSVQRGTAWEYGNVGTGGAPDIEDQDHPARWPYRLARDIVVCFCPPGGLVVDPFVGAGTTAAAAIAEGRRFVGGDLGARQGDGVPWVTVAHGVLTERKRQVGLFGGGR